MTILSNLLRRRNARAAAFALGVAALLGISGVDAFGGEPAWILNNGPEEVEASVGEGTLLRETGLTTIVATGTDCTVSIPMREDDAFDAAARPFFALRYRIESSVDLGGLFFTSDELTSLSDKSFTPFPVVPDGAWRDVVVDMRERQPNWKGTIRSFRLDPTNPTVGGSKIELSRLGFFASEADAKAFLAAANDEPDFDLETVFRAPGQRCVVPGGTLKAGFDRADYLLQTPANAARMGEKSIRPEELVVFKAGEDAKAVALSQTTRLGFTTFVAREKGPYRLGVSGAAAKLGDLDDLPTATARAIRFAVARTLIPTDPERFEPGRALTKTEIAQILQNAESAGVAPDALETLKSALNKPTATRADAAVAVENAVETTLGTSAPTPFAPEYFGRDRIRIGAWGNFRAKDVDENYIARYADCGFDFLLAFVSTPPSDLLRWTSVRGVETYLADGSYEDPEGAAEYADYPSFAGCVLCDEPGSDDFAKWGAIAKKYADATGKVPYINLLPMYANAAQLKYGAGAAAIEYYDSDPDLFRKYCEAFCDDVDGDYICTDIYPLNWVKDKKKFTYPEYVESINVIASVARERNRDFWCYIQTFGWIPSKRTPTEAEYRWQCYSMLAFGCKCILCWTYAGYDRDFPSLVDVESRQQTAWYDARPVLWELRRLSDEFVQYKNIGAFTHNCSDETPYLKMSGELPRDQFGTIREIDCADPLLIGCFERKDAPATSDAASETAPQTAFVVVNMSDLEENRGTTVNLDLDAKKVVVWQRGVPQELKADANGKYNVYLASGEGVFVTVER